MGRLIISTHITVDGVIGPNPGEWEIFEGDGERFKYDQLLAADAFVRLRCCTPQLPASGLTI